MFRILKIERREMILNDSVKVFRIIMLMNCSFFIGHGGSDGLHGYVPSLDHVVADTVSFM